MRISHHALYLLLPVSLAACVTVPDGPSVMVLPGDGKGFEEFRADDTACKQFARNQVGERNAAQIAAESGVHSAAVGTVLGAAAGAAAGGSRGAARGAGGGLALGGLAGSSTAQTSASRLQQRYDIGYQQCMYAKGHKIPSSFGAWDNYFYQPGGRYQSRPMPSPAGPLR